MPSINTISGGARKQTKTVVAGTSNKTVTPDEGYLLSSVVVQPTPAETTTVAAGTSNKIVTPNAGYFLSSVTVTPTPSETKTQAAGTSNVTVTPTSGKLLSKVTVTPTPSETKTATPSTASQNITPSSGKLLSKVTVNAMPYIQTVFKWFDSGTINTATVGTFAGNTEQNGRNNISSCTSDKYLRIYNTSGGYGRSVISTTNYLPKNTYDYVAFYITSLSTTTSNQPLIFGGKTAKNTNAPDVGTYEMWGVGSMTNRWVVAPLAVFNSTSGNHYFAFGGTIDCKITKIYFFKAK